MVGVLSHPVEECSSRLEYNMLTWKLNNSDLANNPFEGKSHGLSTDDALPPFLTFLRH